MSLSTVQSLGPLINKIKLYFVFFCSYWPIQGTHFCTHVLHLTFPQIAWLGFFPKTYAVTWN